MVSFLKIKIRSIFSQVQKIYANLSPGWKFSLGAWFSLRFFYALWGMAIVTFFPLIIQNFEYNNIPTLSVFHLLDNQVYIYERQVNDQLLTFRVLDRTTLIDAETGSHWNASSGYATHGPLQGELLPKSTVDSEKLFPYIGVKPSYLVFFSIWQRFDANWYLAIAQNGYGEIPGAAHFPPLFPLLIRLVSFFTGDFLLAGLLISHLSSIFVIKLLYDLFHEWQSPHLAKRSLVYFMIFPASFFLFSVYSESLFILLVLLFYRAAQKKAWVLAGLCAMLASLTRLQGLALAPVLLYLVYLDKPFLKKASHWLGLGLIPIAGLIYILVRSLSNSRSAVPLVEAEWHARVVFPWQSYQYALESLLSGSMSIVDLTNLFLTTLLIILLVFEWKKIPPMYLIYVAFTVLITVSRIVEPHAFSGMIRFSLSLFPIFALLGRYGQQPLIRRLIIYIFFLFSLYFSAQYWQWGWVA